MRQTHFFLACTTDALVLKNMLSIDLSIQREKHDFIAGYPAFYMTQGPRWEGRGLL